MTTLNKLSYLIADNLNRSNDYVLIEEIKDLIVGWRAKLIRQDIQKNGISSQFNQREILPLITVDVTDSNVLVIDETVKRTRDIVPAGIRTNLLAPYFYVGQADWQRAFGYVNLGQVPFIHNRKFTPCNVYYSYVNGYIYVHGNKDIDYIGISSAFENPEEFANLNDACCCTITGDNNFYLSMDMQDTIVTAIVQYYTNSKPNQVDVKH